MGDWTTGYVETGDGVRLHYTRGGSAGGEGKPPVVLAHGFSDDGTCWGPVAEALAPDYDVVMPDARGHGRSDAPESGYDIGSLAADLRAVIAGLGLNRPAVLGHSMGGATTLVLAGTWPEVPGAILIEDAGARNLGPATDADDAERARHRARSAAWIEKLKGRTREELVAEQRAETPHWSEAEIGPWADAKLRFHPNALNRIDSRPVDWPALLPNIACPALLITADPERGAMVTPEGAEQMRALVPHLQIAHVPGAGHSIRRDRFDSYMAVVRVFLSDDAAGAR